VTAAGEPSAERIDRRWAWGIGLVAALLVVGPGLGRGAWLNVDLVVTDVTPVPRGVWGLGPELPRRVPFALPFAWVSALVPGVLPWKLACVAALASCTAGTWRLVARWAPASSPWVRAGAGLIAGVGPFATTRLGAGHLGMTFALAVLPWALPALLRPADRPARTVAWALALGLAGPFGGTVALPVVAAGLVGTAAWRPGRRVPAVRAALGTLVAQGPWLVPTVVVAAQGTDIATAGDFPTDLSGPGGVLRLLAGHGFWRPQSQLGGAQGWEVAVAGLVLLALAVEGWRRLPADVKAPVALVAGIGLVGAAASAVPGVDGVVAALVDTPAGAAVREGQRLLALWVVVAAPLAALGAGSVARRVGDGLQPVAVAVPMVLAVLGTGPALWGAGGALEPVELPPSWGDVRAAVVADPGTVLVLPWQAYPALAVTDGRGVVSPLGVYLGGDVLASSDPGFGDGRRERADDREARAAVVAEGLEAGEDVHDELLALGVRWVVEIPTVGRRVDPEAPTPAGLRREVVTEALGLHEVEGWAPARRVDDGAPVAVERPVAPVLRTDAAAVRVAAPGVEGWRRGGGTSRSADGLLQLPAGGTAWYPGAIAVLLADVAALALAVITLARLRSTRSGGVRS
jgi:hypothetical protein